MVTVRREFSNTAGTTRTVVRLGTLEDVTASLREHNWLMEEGCPWQAYVSFQNSKRLSSLGYWTDSTKFGLCWEEAAGL